MKTNSIMDFSKFEMEKSQLDKIVGAKKKLEEVPSGAGVGVGGQTVTEVLVMYDDGSWCHFYKYSS